MAQTFPLNEMMRCFQLVSKMTTQTYDKVNVTYQLTNRHFRIDAGFLHFSLWCFIVGVFHLNAVNGLYISKTSAL